MFWLPLFSKLHTNHFTSPLDISMIIYIYWTSMKVVARNYLALLLCSCLLSTGYRIEALSYDYSASIKCLEEPLKPQYGGGIMVNPEFNHGLDGWSVFGSGRIVSRKSNGGNSFLVSHSRNQPYDSFSQKIYMEKDKLYTFSVWIEVSEGKVPVTAVFNTTSGFQYAGAIIAESGCWSMLKGGLTVESSGFAELYFESKNTTMEIWLDSVSLQPFTKEQWSSHQFQSMEKARKKAVRFHAVDAKGRNLDGARILIKQNKPGFPFGSAISQAILNNTAYQNWFTSRFTVTTFENEMKWYANELYPGRETYSVPDAMVQFLKQHGISIRGHNIFWDDPKYQTWWVKKLKPSQLIAATEKRINSVVSRYAGEVIGWDVVNENLHFSYFENILGENASSVFFQRSHQLDPNTIMFMNEYSTIERSGDKKSMPARYLQKLREIQSFPGNSGPMGIGLEGHFKVPNIPYMRATIDTLAAAGLPIWLTEVDVEKFPNQTQYLEEILREGHSHPAVQGIVLWTVWHADGCRRLCLTDYNFRNLPAGDLVDKLIDEWKQKEVMGTTDQNGYYETRLFHGNYDLIISHPSLGSSLAKSFKVIATEAMEEMTVHVHVHDV